MGISDRTKTFSQKIMKIASRKPIIAVIGGGMVDDGIYDLAYETGREIAIREGILICGGLGGVMEGCCKGAKSADGITIGILPGESLDNANRYVDIPVATGMGMARNAIIAHTGRVAIAVDGKYGTLSEIGFFSQLNKPVVGLQTWDIQGITVAQTPLEAVETAFSHLI